MTHEEKVKRMGMGIKIELFPNNSPPLIQNLHFDGTFLLGDSKIKKYYHFFSLKYSRVYDVI